MGDLADIQDRGHVLRLLWLLLLPNPLLFPLQRLQQSQHNIRDKEKMHVRVFFYWVRFGSKAKHARTMKSFPSRSWNQPSAARTPASVSSSSPSTPSPSVKPPCSSLCHWRIQVIKCKSVQYMYSNYQNWPAAQNWRVKDQHDYACLPSFTLK